MTNDLQIQPNIDHYKTVQDIAFIGSFDQWCHSQGWRLVVYGGYGLDAYLQKITRNHGDIDLVIYGSESRSQSLPKIVEYLRVLIKDVEIKRLDQEFMIDIKVKSISISGNFYYVQTVDDPYENLSTLIKLDGTQVTNSLSDFPPPVMGKLGKLEVEVQDQSAHLADILRKRGDGASLSKHDQDIANIQTLLAKK